ncbi:MAG: hypothetical protein GKR89_24325 [Candidatus Latescibacteria bacterium]|nr:hypothetical protein [Candidatus Latescibacterota bacterium]
MASHLEEVEYKNGEKHGPWVQYYAGGGKRREGAFDMGKKTGKWVEYHKNGQPAAVNHYQHNQLIGEHVSYYESGHLKQTGQFNELRGKSSDGRKTGTWTFYATDGKTVWRRITYKNGSRTKADEHPLGVCPECGRVVESPAWEKCPKCDSELA